MYVIGVHSTIFGGKMCLFQGCLLHIGTLKQFIQIDFHGNSSGIIDFLMDLGSIHTTNIQIASCKQYVLRFALHEPDKYVICMIMEIERYLNVAYNREIAVCSCIHFNLNARDLLGLTPQELSNVGRSENLPIIF